MLDKYNKAIMAVSCPTCGVPPLVRCKPANGAAQGLTPLKPHKKRVEAASG